MALPHALCSSSYLPLLPAALWAAPSPFSAVLAGRSASTGAALGELPGVTGRAALAQAFGSDLERLPECQGLCTPYFHALLSSSDPPSEPSSPVPPCRTLAVPSNAWCLATRAGSAPGHVGPLRSADRGRGSPASCGVATGDRKSRPGRSSGETAEVERAPQPWAVLSALPGLPPRFQAGFFTPPPGVRHPCDCDVLLLRVLGGQQSRPAVAGGGHRVHRGLGGVVPAGRLQALASVRHLPAAEAGRPAC